MSAGDSARCANCAHFENAPVMLERLIPGLRSLSSGFAAVRDQDGLCSLHERYLPASAFCADHAVRLPLGQVSH
jgi:hypothetical protein